MDNAADEDARRARSARFATMPIVLAGTIAVTAGLTGPVAHAEPRHDDDAAKKRHVDQDRNVGDRPVFGTAVARPAQTTVTTVAAVTKPPTTYTVRQGDTVSGIAARYGLSAQEVLVRNGLGWNTIIHPGQTLHLASKPAATPAAPASSSGSASSSYHVKQGDTVSGIAARVGVSTSALLAANKLSLRSVIYPGQTLTVPRAGTSGSSSSSSSKPAASASSSAGAGSSATSYTVKSGDTVSGIAGRVGVSTSALLAANKLGQRSVIYPGQKLTVPRAGSVATPTPAAGSATATPAKATGSVKIKAGDTIGAIAAAHGVSVKALLAANGLSYTSTIYAGGTLVLPGAGAVSTGTAAGGAASTSVGSGTVALDGVRLDAEQRGNAATIVSVGRSLGVPDQGIVVALAAALQESSLRNLSYGDRDSVGLFQQRPSQGWGTKAALQDPATATTLFFRGNPGKTRGLLGVGGWSSMSVTKAAQAVQVSAYPDEYAKWEKAARSLLASL